MWHSTGKLLLILLGMCAGAGVAGCAGKLPEPAPNVPEPQLGEVPPGRPLAAVAWLSPANARPDDIVQLHVTVHLAASYYVYGAGAPAEFTPISVALQPSERFVAIGPWTQDDIAPVGGHLTGTIRFSRPLRIGAHAADGEGVVSCQLSYQACNPELCWPVAKEELHASLRIARKEH